MKKSLIIAAVSCLALGCTGKNTAEEENTYTCRYVNYYDYASEVPETERAEDLYFADTLFAGDSRMGSLYLYSDLKKAGAEIWYAESLSLWRIYDMKAEDSESSLYDLMLNSKKKYLYVMIGINEVRTDSFASWIKEAGTMIDEIREKHPDVNIYMIQSYMPRTISGLSEEQMRTQVKKLNDAIRELAIDKHLYYINPDPALTDDTGLVRSDYVWDGLHLNTEGTKALSEYIRTHAVKEEEYVKEICD